MTDKNPGFHHVFLPGERKLPLLLLLHGTGANENDLINLGKMVSPGSAILSPRGKVLENGMPRFFRRLAEGVFDLEDLHFRTNELADFITETRKQYDVSDRPVIALGFSNGANMAASMLLQKPEVLDGAILLRAMTPFEPEQLPDLKGRHILMLSGNIDPIIPIENAKNLANLFERSGADINFKSFPASHQLIQEDIKAMTNWFNVLYTG